METLLEYEMNHAENQRIEREQNNLRASMFDYIASIQHGKRYPVYREFPSMLQQKLGQAETNEQLKLWADTVRAVPQFTSYLPELSGEFIKNARMIWKASVSGNEDILQTVLRHTVEYGKTGKTAPILLVGPPGIGKTLIAKTYGEILDLPCSFIFGPSAAVNRGLAGAPNMYVGASVGAIAQAMITFKIGNPVICIDEIDKASKGISGMPNFQNELLSALDESSEHWHDNYLEMDLDISHVPFVFTANDVDTISAPLLDRMEVVEMKAPTREMLHEIAKYHMLPKVMDTYNHRRLNISENAVLVLVNQMWNNGIRSCRPYKKAIELMLSDAYLEMLESNKTITITEKDAKIAANHFAGDTNCHRIGFLTA